MPHFLIVTKLMFMKMKMMLIYEYRLSIEKICI